MQSIKVSKSFSNALARITILSLYFLYRFSHFESSVLQEYSLLLQVRLIYYSVKHSGHVTAISITAPIREQTTAKTVP